MVAHSRELKSSLKNKNQDGSLRERGESSSFGSQESFSCIWVANNPWGRWGSIYSPHLKKSHWGIFHWISPVDLSGSWCKSLEAGLIPDKSGPTTGEVRWGSLEAGRRPQTRLVWLTGQVRCDHRTSPVGPSGVRYRLFGSRWFTGHVRWNHEIWILDR
jgi:hypothetical protein